MHTIDIAFKHILFAHSFIHDGQEYTKTNFNRGYYYDKNGRKKFRFFKKQTIVKTNDETFRWK